MKQRGIAISLPFLVLVGLLVAAFFLGGSSRDDQAGLIVLRPLSVLVFGFALWGFSAELARRHWIVLTLASVAIILPVLQLVPLPPSIWRMLPGRALIAKIDDVAGLGAVWRPLSLTPSATWNAVYSLFAPLAVLLLGLRIRDHERFMLVPVLLVIGAASAFLGIIQMLGPDNGPLYFYTQTQGDSAVGFFANRNHEAAFLACLFPAIGLLATHESESPRFRARALACCAAGLVLVPLVLITGSRAGFVAGAIGVLLAIALVSMRLGFRRSDSRRGLVPVLGGLIVIVLVLGTLSVVLGRGEAFTRLAEWNPERDDRLEAWETVTKMTLDYFPAGIGFGSFPDAYNIYEPDNLLTSSYLNHAHNDWIELVLTGGLPGLLFLVAIALALVWRVIGMGRAARDPAPAAGVAWLGLAIFAILGFASTTDYPLRVPAMMCIAMLAVLWLACWPGKARTLDNGGRTGRITPSNS